MTFHEYVRVTPDNRNSSDEDKPMIASVDRDLGNHDARLSAIEKDLQSMQLDLREIRDTLKEAKGGWRALMLVGGLAGGIGASLTKLLPWLAGAMR